MRIAAIDLGSNSFHMLIAEIQGPDSFATVAQDKMMIQLGKTALVIGRLDAQTMDRGLRCLEEFRRMALARRVERTIAVATSALREADNGEEFLKRSRQSGLSVRLISGREEARLIHTAVARTVDLRSRRALLVDIGGGSVELTVGDAEQIFYSTSVRLGFLRVQGRFATKDPMSKLEARQIRAYLRESLSGPMSRIRRHKPELIIGTSGSITTLLRLAEQRSGENGSVVGRDTMKAIVLDLLKIPAVQRAKDFDLDPLRSEYLPTALLCLDAVIEGIGMDAVSVCPVALREGIIYEFLSSAKPPTKTPKSGGDLRMRAILDLAGRCDYPVEHSHRVAQLARQIFQQTESLHGLGEREAQWLEYASILHDIGYHIGYSKHHKHAFYLVMNCDLRGFNPEERAVLANLVRYHRRATPRKSHAPFGALSRETQKVVKYLAAILRIADGLDMSHFSLVDEVRCFLRKKKILFQLVVDGSSSTEVDIWAAKKDASYFEKLFGMETEFVARKSTRSSTRSGASRK